MRTAGNESRRIKAFACVAAMGVGLGLGVDRASASHIRVRSLRHRSAVWVPPVYETRARTITIPAVFEDRPRKVWHEAVFEERRVLAELPAEVVTREVPRYDRLGRLIGYDRVEEVVRPTHNVWRTETVLVRPEYYETAYERVLVRPAEIRVVFERVLVRPGHWAQPRRLAIRKHRPFPRAARVRRGLDGRDRRPYLTVRVGR